MELSKIKDENFLFLFKRMDVKNKPMVKTMFRELLSNREFTFEDNLEKSFCSLCAETLPEILAKKVRCKNAFEVVTSNLKEFKSFDVLTEGQPYLLRQQGGNVVGMVRISKSEDIGNKEFNYTVLDCIPFIEKQEMKSDVKFNDEKMQMFSVAYRSWESWGQEDTDGEYIRNEDLGNMVKSHAVNPVFINLEHQKENSIDFKDARVTELYQARTDWFEEGLSIRKGDLLATTQFYETPRGKALWNDLKENKYSTYSIEGDPLNTWEREIENVS